MRKLWYIKKKILENQDNKNWDNTKKIYGIYNENDEIVYIGSTKELERRWEEHKKGKYRNNIFKELKKGDDEKLNWEIVYIQWYSLINKLDNKLHKLKHNKLEKTKTYEEYVKKFKSYYKYEYMYSNPYIKKYDIIDSKCISKILKKSINDWKNSPAKCSY